MPDTLVGLFAKLMVVNQNLIPARPQHISRGVCRSKACNVSTENVIAKLPETFDVTMTNPGSVGMLGG